jgi:hypothetical protein
MTNALVSTNGLVPGYRQCGSYPEAFNHSPHGPDWQAWQPFLWRPSEQSGFKDLHMANAMRSRVDHSAKADRLTADRVRYPN